MKSIEDATPREEALKLVKIDRTIFLIMYNTALPSVSGILQHYWRVMTKDQYLYKGFPQAPMVAFNRLKNLRDKAPP